MRNAMQCTTSGRSARTILAIRKNSRMTATGPTLLRSPSSAISRQPSASMRFA
jgi:hypothetical protein